MAETQKPPAYVTKREGQSQEGYGTNQVEEGEIDLTILRGEDMQWTFDKRTGKWYVSYGLPNSARRMVFEADAAQMDALFGKNQRPSSFNEIWNFQKWISRDYLIYSGDISEMEGTGSFEDEFQRVISIALDDGKLPDWAANDPAILDLIFIAEAEGKDQNWLLEQMSNRKSFKQRFPWIDAFKKEGLNLEEAIEAGLQYEAGIEGLMERYGKDQAKVNPRLVAALAGQGHSLTDIEDTMIIWDRMSKNMDALEAFNQVLVAHGQQPLDKKGMFQFMKGNAPEELYAIYEQSSFKEAANKAGIGALFSADDAIRAALASPSMTSLEEATQGMQQAADLLLRMRHELDIMKFGLTHEELIDMKLGLAPRSGRSESEIQDAVTRAIQSARGFVEARKSNPFKQYQGGVPQSTSLSKSRAES